MTEIKIIYEDGDILVLDKPAGVTVNKAETTRHDFTVWDWLTDKFPFFNLQTPNGDADFYKRAGIVHRIDKETSGILIVAKNMESFEHLQNQFKNRNIEKTYIALVHGRVDVSEGEISVPVGRLPWNRKRFGVLAGGKEAFTRFRVLQNFNKPFTLLKLNPKTGRTHQIRVHLKYFNHPVFGDLLYAGRKTSRQDRKILSRVFLHAKKLNLTHPKTGKRMEFESPLPAELQNVLELIKD